MVARPHPFRQYPRHPLLTVAWVHGRRVSCILLVAQIFQQRTRSRRTRLGEIAMTATTAAASHHIGARELVTPDELAHLRKRVEWKGIALIVHAWIVIFGAMALVALFPNPVTCVLAVMLIGSRQLGLAILMHDGAHRCFSRNESRNMALSQWLCAYPIFADTQAYRRYHLQHHAHTKQEDDPDLPLSAPFPITRASYRRKFLRDIMGRTGYEQRKAQLINALGDPSWPLMRRARHFREKLGPQVAVNALLWAGLALAGIWWAYPLLWLLPLLTWMMVVIRIRNIAEHAVIPDRDDPLRNTRTTEASLLERMFIAPYFVNYHLEHHLLFYVPCYNLPRLHAILMQGPHAARMEVQRGYLSVMRLATARPDAEDRPGNIVNNARRRRGGNDVSEDQASAGF
jgi:fatty acid desaturase